MTEIRLNPDRLSTVIGQLRHAADSAELAKTAIDTECTALHNPTDIGDFLSNAPQRIERVRQTADEVKACKDAIVTINSCGIGTKDSIGQITVSVPEGVSISCHDDMTTWASALQDARDLESLSAGGIASKGSLPSGRSYDDVIASIESRKGKRDYAAILIDALGPENLTQVPLDVVDYFTVEIEDSPGFCMRPNAGEELAPLLGELLATASYWWTPERKNDVAAAIAESMDENGEYGNATVLNAMLQGHDVDDDGVSDIRFDTDFLVSLAREVEEINWSAIKPYATLSGESTGLENDGDASGYVKRVLGPSLEGYSFDSLTGVLYAMIPDEQAALTFLEHDDGTPEDTQRVEALLRRNEIGTNDWTDIWAGLVDRTSSVYATEFATIEDPATPEAKGTAALAATVVNTIGEHTNELSALSRRRITDVLTAYPWSVDQAARTDGTSNEPAIMPGSIDANGNPEWSYGMSYQPQFTGTGLAGVMQAIARDKTDFKTVVTSVGALEQRRMIFAALAVGLETDGSGLTRDCDLGSGLLAAIEANSATAGFFEGAARAVVENDAEAIDERNEVIIDYLFALSCFIPGPGGSVSHLEKSILAYTQDRTKSALKNEATDTFTDNLANALSDSEVVRNDASRGQTVTTITQMISLGIIPAAHANAAVPGLVDADGQIDATKLDGAALDQLYDRFVTNPNDTLNVTLIQALKGTDDDYDKGYQRGNR